MNNLIKHYADLTMKEQISLLLIAAMIAAEEFFRWLGRRHAEQNAWRVTEEEERDGAQ